MEMGTGGVASMRPWVQIPALPKKKKSVCPESILTNCIPTYGIITLYPVILYDH
jgi:hypothetical protein